MTNAADGWTQESLFPDRSRSGKQTQPGGAERQPVADSIPRLIDITDVAEHLGVPVRHVRRLVAERRIPYVRWGHHLRFSPVEIREWLDQARVAPDVQRPAGWHPR
jgi:excisionase family DNA binding protein